MYSGKKQELISSMEIINPREIISQVVYNEEDFI